MRILVAEDDLEMRCLVVEALRKDGYEVIEAEDGGRLFELLVAALRKPLASIDLVVADVRMPVCNALEVLEAFLRAAFCPPIILMTAFPNDDTRHRASRLGALMLDKPLSIESLLTAVRRFGRQAKSGH
jgi:two-component system chemotaxis response regulator CheY